MTPGAALMNQLHSGAISKQSTKFLTDIKRNISEAIVELLDVGARIRPLLVGDVRVGWVRGVHPLERQILRRWLDKEQELLEQVVLLGTSLTKTEVQALSFVEIRGILRVIQAMTDSDLTLYPYMSAFSTTSTSEYLWFSGGKRITDMRNQDVTMPDGKVIHILCGSDHARLWAAMCHYRERNKERIDDSLNAALIIRPWVGQGANTLTNDLKNALRNLATDIDDPWTGIVSTKHVDKDDGWGHGGGDSIEDIHRELQGMLSNDKHEQFMKEWTNKLKDAAKKKAEAVEALIEERIEGVSSSVPVVMTEQEVMQRMQDLRKGASPNLVETDFQSKGDSLKRFDKYS